MLYIYIDQNVTKRLLLSCSKNGIKDQKSRRFSQSVVVRLAEDFSKLFRRQCLHICAFSHMFLSYITLYHVSIKDRGKNTSIHAPKNDLSGWSLASRVSHFYTNFTKLAGQKICGYLWYFHGKSKFSEFSHAIQVSHKARTFYKGN